MNDYRAIMKTCLEAMYKCHEILHGKCNSGRYEEKCHKGCPYFHNLCDLATDIRLIFLENPIANFPHLALRLRPMEMYDLAVQILLNA